MKNNIKFLLGLSVFVGLFVSCSSDDDDDERGNWIERSIFDGVPRSNAASFVIDDLGSMGTGYDGDDYLNDFWQYNIEGNYWSQKANFPGSERSSASGMNIDGDGYIGIGYDGLEELEDFYKYDVASNSWSQISNFGGGVRRAAVSFAVNSTGYVGTGYDGDNDLKDFWKYTPATDTWSELVGFGGDKRRDATTFTIDNKVYLGTGISNGVYKNDCWVFDPATEVWTSLTDLDEEDDYSVVRSNAVGFEMNGLGYIATGYYGGAMTSIWEYDPINDDWEEITNLEATARQDAVAFSTGTRAFVALGKTGTLYLDDTFEVFPQDSYDDED